MPPDDAGYLSSRALTLRHAAIERGVLLRPLGNVLYALPPACTTEAEARHIGDTAHTFEETALPGAVNQWTVARTNSGLGWFNTHTVYHADLRTGLRNVADPATVGSSVEDLIESIDDIETSWMVYHGHNDYLLLGTEIAGDLAILVFDIQRGGWWLVSGEDGYVGWVHEWVLRTAGPDPGPCAWRYARPRGTLFVSDHLAASPLLAGMPLWTVDGPLPERNGFHLVRTPTGAEGWLSAAELGPAAALAGGAFLVLCYVVARTLLPGRELPVGAVTALAGGPLFLFLLRRQAHRVFAP